MLHIETYSYICNAKKHKNDIKYSAFEPVGLL